jgi:hypothetical protein
MRVRDLQQFLESFTARDKSASGQGNAISDAVIYVDVKALGPLPPNTSPISMYHGSRIRELVTYGLKLDACYSGLDACRLAIERVGSKA